MRILSPSFAASLQAARSSGIAPVWFAHFVAKDRDSGAEVDLGLWSGRDPISIGVQAPDGTVEVKSYIGGCGLWVTGLQYVADLTDNPVKVSISQIAPMAQKLMRGYDLRLARCQIHATTMRGGVLVDTPHLLWVGLVDEGGISTPQAGGDGEISITVRSELMAQLMSTNPAKSSDQHQKRRQAGDRFSEYSGSIGSRKIDWYKG